MPDFDFSNMITKLDNGQYRVRLFLPNTDSEGQSYREVHVAVNDVFYEGQATSLPVALIEKAVAYVYKDFKTFHGRHLDFNTLLRGRPTKRVQTNSLTEADLNLYLERVRTGQIRLVRVGTRSDIGGSKFTPENSYIFLSLSANGGLKLLDTYNIANREHEVTLTEVLRFFEWLSFEE